MAHHLPIAQLIAFTDAAYRNRMAHLDHFSRAERTMKKGSPERQHIERTDYALCHLYNDALRAVIRAPVATIEEAQAKAAFLLRPQFGIADLFLGDDEDTVLGLLHSLTVPATPAEPTRFARAYAAYCAEDAAHAARNRFNEPFAPITARFFEAAGTPPVIETAADAATALRHVLASDAFADTFDERLTQGVCAFLEGLDGKSP